MKALLTVPCSLTIVRSAAPPVELYLTQAATLKLRLVSTALTADCTYPLALLFMVTVLPRRPAPSDAALPSVPVLPLVPPSAVVVPDASEKSQRSASGRLRLRLATSVPLNARL